MSSPATVHPLPAIRCGHDPRETPGLVPGERCPHCRNPVDPWPHETAMVYAADARNDLKVAASLTDRALLADDDGDTSRRDYMLAAAALAASRATNALAFAAASLDYEEGAASVGADRRP